MSVSGYLQHVHGRSVGNKAELVIWSAGIIFALDFGEQHSLA
jgi:hypothetical protein